jgi:hypothetical protein
VPLQFAAVFKPQTKDMQNLNEFKLIDGVFTAEEATQVLTALINYKIDYHNREDFAITFRFNKDLEHSKELINSRVKKFTLLYLKKEYENLKLKN